MQVTVGRKAWMPGLTAEQKRAYEKMFTLRPEVMDQFGKESYEVKLYSYDSEGRMGIPRGYFLDKLANIGNLFNDIQIIDAAVDGMPLGKFQSLVSYEGREEQEIAINTMLRKLKLNGIGGGILQAGTGTGKTVMALQIAYILGRRTLIFVHKDFLVQQWVSRIKEFFPGASIGIIKQKTCQYNNDFVIASIQSNTGDKFKKYPEEMFKAFGTVITDECHRIGSEKWHPVASLFAARYRLGVTATPRRLDKAENIFFYEIGPILYRMKSVALVPQVVRVILDTDVAGYYATNKYGGKYFVPASKMNMAQWKTALSDIPERNEEIVKMIYRAASTGRKIMVVSERLEQLWKLERLLKEALKENPPQCNVVSGFYTGDWFIVPDNVDEPDNIKWEELKKVKRTTSDLAIASQANVIFTTVQMTAEGLDITSLDVLIIALPVGNIEQVVGRIRRPCLPKSDRHKCRYLCKWRAEECSGKPRPIVVDFIDRHVDYARERWIARAKFYTAQGMMKPNMIFID